MNQGMPDEALAIVDRACEAWDRFGRSTDPRMARLLHLRGKILTDLQHPLEARNSLVRAFDLYLAAGDVSGAISAALTPALEKDEGVWISSNVAGGRGLDELRERAFELASPGSGESSWLQLHRGTREGIEAALVSAHCSGNLRLAAAALSQLAYNELLACDLEACATHLGEASTVALPLHDPWIDFGCAYIHCYHGWICGDRTEAGLSVERLFDLARQTRSRRILTVAHHCAAILACRLGLWKQAREHAGQVLAFCARTGSVFDSVKAHDTLFELELQTGHLKAATRWRASTVQLFDVPYPADIRLNPLGVRVTGDSSTIPKAPERTVLPVVDGKMHEFVIVPLLRHAYFAAIHNDRTKAAEFLEWLRPWRGTWFSQSMTDNLLGRLCSTLDRIDEATVHYEEGLDFCRRAGYRPEQGWTSLDYAEVLVRRGGAGDRDHALRLLDEALQISRELEMLPLRNQCQAARDRLCGRSSNHATPPDSLTPRELEVLRLIARGFTNAEIAERLYISPLTAARHIHNLLDKTGMANRAEAVAYATRHGLTDG